MTDYKVKFYGKLPGTVEWTSSLGVTSEQTPSELITTMAAALGNMWSNGTYGIGAQYVPGVTLDGFDVITLNGTFRETLKSSHALSLVGTSGDAALSNNTTMTIRKESPGLQKWQRGFLSLPAPVEGVLVDGLYTNTARDRFGAALESVRTAVQADGSTIYINTGNPGPEDHFPAYTKTVITKLAASNKPGTRRQRTRKVVAAYS